MKWRPIYGYLGALIAMALATWFVTPRTPTIHFVGTRLEGAGTVAVFQILNDSRSPFSFFGSAPAKPYCQLRWPASAGGREVSLCLKGKDPSSMATTPPHTTSEFVIPFELIGPGDSVGLLFQRGTVAEVKARNRGWLHEWDYKAHRFFRPNDPWPESWSEPVK